MTGRMRPLVGAMLIATSATAADFAPARRIGGLVPTLPGPTVVGWLDETVEIAVDTAGNAANVTLVRGTADAPRFLAPAATTWRFRPATDGDRPVSTHVLAVASFRPPQLYGGPTLGAPPVDLATISNEMPLPTARRQPKYPPLTLGDAVVLVEVLVGVDGRVREATVLEGAAGFDDESLIAAREWVFRPARHNGELVPAYAYLVFGFRRPVV